MSESKFIMACKLANIQKSLMGRIVPGDWNDFIPFIFEECLKEKVTFWFNFFENECVLNLRDIEHENYELNIRQYYGNGENDTNVMFKLLRHAFLLTGTSSEITSSGNEASSEKTVSEENVDLISSEKLPPKTINKAINELQAKDLPVNRSSLKNTIPWSQLSTDERIKCTRYLENMGASK